jgi:hypothetical protein
MDKKIPMALLNSFEKIPDILSKETEKNNTGGLLQKVNKAAKGGNIRPERKPLYDAAMAFKRIQKAREELKEQRTS